MSLTPEEQAAKHAAEYEKTYRRPATEEDHDAQVMQEWNRYVAKAKASGKPVEESLNTWRNKMVNADSTHPGVLHPIYRTGRPAGEEDTTPTEGVKPISRERRAPINR